MIEIIVSLDDPLEDLRTFITSPYVRSKITFEFETLINDDSRSLSLLLARTTNVARSTFGSAQFDPITISYATSRYRRLRKRNLRGNGSKNVQNRYI